MEMKFKDFDAAEFLMPRAGKIAILVSLLLVSTVLIEQRQCAGSETVGFCVNKLGFPASAYGLYGESDLVQGSELNNFNKMFLFGAAINIIFWYFAACIAVYAYSRFTGKGKLGEVG
ncbi:MAG: hypothetical protein ABH863_00035 [Candidatus Micrarchaeota archaeon]